MQRSKTCNAPGLVILIPRGKFGDNDDAMAAAAYGLYTVSFKLDAGAPGAEGLFHGQNGVFRPPKNRHISAAVHVRPKGTATYFPNPYTLHPIPEDAALFTGASRANVKFV